MPQICKSRDEAIAMGASLRARRKELGLSWENLSITSGVDKGQISRFENGEFRRVSPNLQKLLAILQIPNPSVRAADTDSETSVRELVVRFEKFAAQSERHRAAAQALLWALDQVG